MVYLKDYLDPRFVVFLEDESKEDVLNHMIDVLSQSENILDKDVFRKAVFAREEIISTGIGLSIAIPHVKIPEVKDFTIAIGVSKKEIEWNAIDNKPVQVIFLIAGASDQHQTYLRILSKIVLVLKKADRREKLLSAKNAEDVLNQFSQL